MSEVPLYGVAMYSRVYGLSTSGPFKKSSCSSLCGVEQSKLVYRGTSLRGSYSQTA